jgi:transcriptional regulator with PAS, ATPase and Fis domain
MNARGKFALIAPNSAIAELAHEAAKSFDGRMTVYEGNLEQGVQAAIKAIEDGNDVLISRGGTAAMIERAVKVPVVNIVFSGMDFITTIEKAKRYENRFALFGYENLFGEIKEEYTCFGCIIYIVKVNDATELRKTIVSLHVEKQIRVFLGGIAVVREATELGFTGILIESSPESIKRAAEEAARLAHLKVTESEQYLQFKAITEHSSNGIIYLDAQNNVKYINPFAYNLLFRKGETVIDQPIGKVCPLLKLPEKNTALHNHYQILNGARIVLNHIPLHLGQRMIGKLVSFEDVTKIEELENKVRHAQHTKGLTAKYTFDGIMAVDPAMKRVLDVARRVAATESSILLTGESGTGKELFAQSIHNASPRKNGPFVAINCAALPETILESELFGYSEGAFTGARKSGKAGLFELAHMGTIFLDEIGDISLNVQSRLIRVIQEREVIRIGDDRIIPINIRIISATNKDLASLVTQGLFRADLFFRLDIVRIKIPSLRERQEDIPFLLNYFLGHYCQVYKLKPKTVTPGAMELLTTYPWPGNVRELQNFVEGLVIISESDVIDKDFVQQLLRDKLGGENRAVREENAPKAAGILHEREYESIREVLRNTNGNKAKAAKILGISTTTLWRRLNANKKDVK